MSNHWQTGFFTKGSFTPRLFEDPVKLTCALLLGTRPSEEVLRICAYFEFVNWSF